MGTGGWQQARRTQEQGFEGSSAAPGISARYYMHRNFFLDDPDSFTVSRQLLEEREIHAPLTLNEAEISIALSAASGGMYEIGDDLPTLGADTDRLALLKNPDLLRMAKLGRAAFPLDLLSYHAEDEQPSVFLLREDARQSILAVFNWTEQPRSHHFSRADLNFEAGHAYELHDVFAPEARLSMDRDAIQLEQPAHSVKLIKMIDSSVPAAAPTVSLHVPDHAKVGEEVQFVSAATPDGAPAISYRWDFGDGTTEDGRRVSHAYTMAGRFSVRLIVEGIDGISAEKRVHVSVGDTAVIPPPRRYKPNE